jgi:hypothetical protein
MSDREYQTKVSEFFNEGYHATGAKLLYVIEEARGRDAVLRVMKDPRSLLVVYNECATEKKEPFRFDPALADAVKVMGGADPRPAAKGDIEKAKAGADPYAG